MYNSNDGGNVTPRQPNRPTNEKPTQLMSSPIQRRRRTTPGGTSITNEEVMYNTTQTPPDYSTPTKGGNGDWVATKDNKNALLASRRKDTVKNVLEEIGILDSRNSTGIPFGATKEKNQYLLLTAPRNQRFLAQLGLNEEVSSKIPQKRKEIDELFHQLDPDLSGWITTGHLLQYFHELDLPLTTSEIERLVKMCDLNEDGFIQPVDLVNALQKMQPMQSVSMCMPSQLGRAKHLADSILMTEAKTSKAQSAILDPEKPKDILNDIFDLQSPIQRMPVPAPIKPKSFGPGLIIPTQSSDHYADATEQMETMNMVMDWNNALGTKPPGIEETHRKIQQRNRRLDNIKEYVDSLTARCRERDVVVDNYEQGHIQTKIKQRARYQKAALFGADLHSRMEQKKKNRLLKLSKSPVHQQTFAISPRGTVRPVKFHPGTTKYYRPSHWDEK